MPPGMNTVVADPTKADQVLAEVIPGILEWSGRHPNHGSIVHSHYLTEQRVAIDPIGIDGIVAALERAGGVEQVVLTNRHHLRGAEEIIAASGAVLRCPRTGLHAFEGADTPTAVGYGWEEEVAEFFVTAKGLERYFELQWNPLGGVFDAIIDNKLDQQGVSTNFNGDWNFTAKGMKSAVKVKGTVGNANDKDESWQVEVVLPFADLGEPAPKPTAVWRANFYRFNRAKDQSPELLSWSPTRFPSFHQPARFGYLEFGK